MKQKLFVVATLGCLALVTFSGCREPDPLSGDPKAGAERSRKLTALASQEADQVADPDKRLTRELNLANLQIDRDWKDDAGATLAMARDTLSRADAANLHEQARLGGWVSISELSRRINDEKSAAAATDAAVAELNKLPDPAHRCDYVMGVANELQYIKGKDAAAGQLGAAGAWTRSIDNIPQRQAAVIAFATALFNIDEFDAGRKMLEQEPDPAWRADQLMQMAQATPQAPVLTVAHAESADVSRSMAAGTLSSPPAGPSPATQPFYGKALSYEQVFKDQQNSRTSK